jgi:S1-C subfamily serine protease
MKAGLKPSDVITDLNGKEVTDSKSIQRILSSEDLRVGDTLSLTYLREGKSYNVKLKLVQLPSNH